MKPRLKALREQVAVVFGASSGIGRATALELARRGAQVVVAARSRPGLASLIDEIARGGGQAHAVVADVADFDQVRAAADAAVTVYGRIDTWIHLAGVSLYARVEDTAPEEFRRVIEVNLLGQVHGALAALPHLRRTGGGALIHVSSVEAMVALPWQSAYAASKFGVRGFLEALRIELQGEGVPISVTNVMPASVDTPLFDKARTRLGVRPKGVPPVYRPEVVVRAIAYAAEHPTREIVAGGAAKALILQHALAPRLTDRFLTRMASSQKTDRPKPPDAPDNIDGPIAGFDRVDGDYGHRTLSRSFLTWLATHPRVRWALTAGAVVMVAAGAVVLRRL